MLRLAEGVIHSSLARRLMAADIRESALGNIHPPTRRRKGRTPEKGQDILRHLRDNKPSREEIAISLNSRLYIIIYIHEPYG